MLEESGENGAALGYATICELNGARSGVSENALRPRGWLAMGDEKVELDANLLDPTSDCEEGKKCVSLSSSKSAKGEENWSVLGIPDGVDMSFPGVKYEGDRVTGEAREGEEWAEAAADERTEGEAADPGV